MRFSNRFAAWSLEPNELSLLLKKKRAGGEPIIDLTESNPTRAGFVYPDGLLDVLRTPQSLLYEPSPFGLTSAREAVAKMHRVDTDRVIITASTSESYAYLFKLLCDPGDEVLIPQPSYPLVDFLAKLEHVQLRPYLLEYRNGHWSIDLDSIAAGPKTRAILLVNPNNPTGSYLKRWELERLTDIASRHDLTLISDEVFSCYPMEEDSERIETLAAARRDHSLTVVAQNGGQVTEPRALASGLRDEVRLAAVIDVPAVCLSGLSKMAGLPQMKAGWMILSGPKPWVSAASDRLELIADTYLSVSTPIQHALPTWLESSAVLRTAIIERALRNLGHLPEALHVEGGWYAIVPLGDIDEYDFTMAALEEDNVLVQPGFFYDFDGGNYLVISLLPPPDVFENGITRLRTRLAASRQSSHGLP